VKQKLIWIKDLNLIDIIACTKTIHRQLRLKHNSAFGNRFLKGYRFNEKYKSGSTCCRVYKGFKVVPEAVGNTLLPIVLISINIKPAVYYKSTKANGAETDISVVYSRSNAYSASSNYIKKYRGDAVMSATPTVDDFVYNAALIVRLSVGYISSATKRSNALDYAATG
jgi:hypothetical protein